MTSTSSPEQTVAFTARYELALRTHLAEPGEQTLSEAYELGRGALQAGMSMLDVAAAHHASLLGSLHSEQDQSLLPSMSAAAAAFFIESLSSYEITQRGLREAQETARLEHEQALALNGLAEAAVALNAVRDLGRLLDLVCAIARELIGADCASVEITPDRGAPLSARSLAERHAGWMLEASLTESSELVASALASGRPTRLSAERLAELRLGDRRAAGRRRALKGWLGVPLRAREGARQLGLLEVADKTGGGFTENDEAIIAQLAQMAAVALENLWLYEREHSIALALQHSLLPRELPDIAGLELAARYRAAGDGNEVGGDFYDVVELGPDRWLLIIGDVCGKGALAAATTGLARHTIRSTARREHAPEAILTALNEALLADAPGTQFCTVACALIELSEAGPRVQLANAGHPRPLLRRVDGRAHPVGPGGTLLGFVDDPRLVAEGLALGPGEALVFYTDGVTDARAPQRSWTPEQLADEIGFAGASDAEALADRVQATAGPDDVAPRDDIAILVVRARG